MPLRIGRSGQHEQKLPPDREELYKSIKKRIGKTPFVEVTGLDLPRGNRIYAKEEYRNPTGSHYDREMWQLFHELELAGVFVPGETKLLETTTGNSGAAFAWLCRALHYPSPKIIIPEDMPHARIAQIRSFDAEIIPSPAGEYITGISKTFQERAPDLTDKENYYCPQHWNDEYHGVAAMKELGEEILDDADRAHVEFDYFFLALGNGGSARGVGEMLKKARGDDITLIGVEPKESPIIAEALRRKPIGKWESHEKHESHQIIGTGPFLPSEIYRNMKWVIENDLLSEVLHPSSTDALETQRELMDKSMQHVGMSSAAVVWAIRCFLQAEENRRIRNKSFGVIFYDPAWKYL